MNIFDINRELEKLKNKIAKEGVKNDLCNIEDLEVLITLNKLELILLMKKYRKLKGEMR